MLSLINLSLLTGQVGRYGAGLNPLRGQSNVQGGGDVGAIPDRLPGFQDIEDASVRAAFDAAWGSQIPPYKGWNLTQMLEAMERGGMTTVYVIGENPVQSEADCEHTVKHMSNLDHVVMQDIFRTKTAQLAHVVLPASAAWCETDGTFTNSERRVQRVRKPLLLGPQGVIREVADAKLIGRGGAAFPTGRKWAATAGQPDRPHYLVCNADESEPGTFKDRVLMEGDPFAVIEAMTVAAYVTGCTRGYLYIRGEYPRAFDRLQNAVAVARERGFLGANIMGQPGFEFDIEIRRGAGAYICGEETAILNSIEGYRGEPRSKPPFPVEKGLFGSRPWSTMWRRWPMCCSSSPKGLDGRGRGRPRPLRLRRRHRRPTGHCGQ